MIGWGVADGLSIVYFPYQALILCSVTGALPAVDLGWVPLVFSVTLSVIYLSCLARAVSAVHRAQHELDLARMELGLARTELGLFLIGGPTTPGEVRYRKVKRRVVSGVVFGLLVAYAAVMAVACWVIPPETAVDDGGGFEH